MPKQSRLNAQRMKNLSSTRAGSPRKPGKENSDMHPATPVHKVPLVTSRSALSDVHVDCLGMAIILRERGFGDMSKVLAQCKDFKCAPGASNCCCRRILYNQPDFQGVESLLEISCREKGVTVLFLPKFHCELNFIEQCWGYAKRIYRLNAESSREDVLERNALSALESVPLESMRKFATRSRRFMDAYSRGLNGRQAAWAARKYRGHRVLPESILNDLEKANIV